VVSGVTVTNTLLLTNGVAVGNFGANALTVAGYGKLVSVGSAGRMNSLVRYNLAQEQSNDNWIGYIAAFGPSWYTVQMSGSNAVSQCSFTLWAAAGMEGSVGPYHFFQPYTVVNSWFSHCQFTSGTMSITSGLLAVTNCVWERVCAYLNDGPHPSTWYYYNNLFVGGVLAYSLSHNPPGTLVAFDNLFDRTTLSSYVCTNGYNAYVTNYYRMQGSQGGDVILTNSPVYQTGYLGNYYYPTNCGLLSTLIDAGSRYAPDAGLYHFTTTTNQAKEAATKVDIGFHYVVVDLNTGQPYDTDGDGVPDYLEDANGNGAVDSGETDWQSATDLGLKVLITRPRNGANPLP
jgi:hypothetical protein